MSSSNRLTSCDWSRPLAANLPKHPLCAPQDGMKHLAGDDLKQAIDRALSQPLDFPQLSELAYEGDCIVIALQAATRDSQRVLGAILNSLNKDRAEPLPVTLLTDTFTASQLDLTQFPDISLAIHDPDGENQFACLAVGVNDQPLYIHRLLFDADVVIPVGCLGPTQNFEIDDCIFPGFSNRQSLNNFREQSEKDQRADIQHVNDLLGTFFAIQLVVGPGDAVHGVYAGDRKAVLKAAKQQLGKAWAVAVPATADLIVATIESQATEQSWDDFAQALINVVPCCEVSAPIVICSQLRRTPTRETRAALVDPLPAAEKRTLNKLSQMRQIVGEHPIFLSSNLSQAEVEEIGLGYLSAPEELQRLVEKSSHGLFLRDAHKCEITLGEG